MEQWWNDTDRGTPREGSNGGMILTAEQRENGAMVE